MGEAFMDGDWSSPDLVAVVRLAVRNLDQVESGNKLFSALSSIADSVRHRLRGNTMSGSRRNISYHYDLGNDFYRLFLDPTMAYSCACYQTPEDSLEQAQLNKYESICRKLDLRAADHLLEIGTGWGGFAAYAARKYGCRITTTTISRQQHDYAKELFAGMGAPGDRITLLLEDYRNLQGQFDKIVSIEMFEAVGLRYYDTYFGACDRLLKADGSMVHANHHHERAKVSRVPQAARLDPEVHLSRRGAGVGRGDSPQPGALYPAIALPRRGHRFALCRDPEALA